MAAIRRADGIGRPSAAWGTGRVVADGLELPAARAPSAKWDAKPPKDAPSMARQGAAAGPAVGYLLWMQAARVHCGMPRDPRMRQSGAKIPEDALSLASQAHAGPAVGYLLRIQAACVHAEPKDAPIWRQAT